MAYAQITHTWPDGSRTTMRVGTDRGDGAYPDQLAELNARVLDLWNQVVVDSDPDSIE